METVDISTQRGSNDALSIIDGALDFIDNSRADLGAIQNRFSATISNLENVSQNVSAARSRIQDADFAQESSKLAKSQILQQAGVSMLAQANASSQSVLSLLG
nr:flagellin [Methylomarinum sp. Ch1-1]MDP4519240.1 flagellin [Methylomarinum sp. Ch1-1]